MPSIPLRALVLVVSCLSTALAFAQQPPYEAEYQKARRVFYRFKADKEKQKYRHNWQNAAHLFERVAEKYPTSPRADDALFTAGRLYYQLYVISRVSEDINKSVSLFGLLVNRHPDSHLADDAQLHIALQWLEFRKNPGRAARELHFLAKTFPDGDVTPRALRMLEDLGGLQTEPAPRSATKAKAQVQKPLPAAQTVKAAGEVSTERDARESPVLFKIRTDAGPDYTRVTLHTRKRARYKFGVLSADETHAAPRLYLDLLDTRLDPDLTRPVLVRDSVVRQVRFAPHAQNVVRIVLDLASPGEHKVFPMDHPARVVVDVSASEDRVATLIGKQRSAKPAAKSEPRAAKPRKEKNVGRDKAHKAKLRLPPKKKSRPGRSLSMLAGLKIRRVVIDPGHGGRDPGAIGPKKTLEKDVVLDIAKRLAGLLRKDEGLGLKEVILTRKADRFVALERRTAMANSKKADLFISIHCNAYKSRRMRGVETFYLDLTNDRYSIKLAARENATSEKTISDLRYILADLALKSHVDDSISLGESIQKALVGKLRRHHKRVRDLKLKPALFYVLIGARMPSVLVETSFLTNPEEERRLRSTAYRQRLAEGIHLGIRNFIEKRNRELDPDS